MWRIENICGREAAVKDYDIHTDGSVVGGVDVSLCSDCGRPTKELVTELGVLDNHCQPRIWGYCGKCEVG